MTDHKAMSIDHGLREKRNTCRMKKKHTKEKKKEEENEEEEENEKKGSSLRAPHSGDLPITRRGIAHSLGALWRMIDR